MSYSPVHAATRLICSIHAREDVPEDARQQAGSVLEGSAANEGWLSTRGGGAKGEHEPSRRAAEKAAGLA